MIEWRGERRTLGQRRRPVGVLCLTAVYTALACADSTPPQPTPELPAPDVGGSFVLVRAAGYPLEQLCFPLDDPARGAMMSVGLLSFDTTRLAVRQQEVRLGASGCGRADSVVVDQERSYRLSGPLVLVDRPATASGPVTDTGTVLGSTLVLRRGGSDFVYEHITESDGVFYLRVSDIDTWLVGWASFAPEGLGGTNWWLRLEPSHSPRNQRAYFFRAAGRPASGTYQVGQYPSATFSVRLARDLAGGGQFFDSGSGTVTITESTPERMAGAFVVDLTDGSGNPTRLEGRFVARCSLSAGCP